MGHYFLDIQHAFRETMWATKLQLFSSYTCHTWLIDTMVSRHGLRINICTHFGIRKKSYFLSGPTTKGGGGRSDH